MPRAEGLSLRCRFCSVPLGIEPSCFLRCLGSVGSWLSFLRLPALSLPWLCARCLACPCGVWRLLRLSSLVSSLSPVVSLPLSALLSAPSPRVFSGLRALAARPFSLLAPALVGPRPARGLSAWLCPVGPSLAVCLGASLSLRGFGRLFLAAWLPACWGRLSPLLGLDRRFRWRPLRRRPRCFPPLSPPFRPSRAVSPRQVAVLSLPPAFCNTFAAERPLASSSTSGSCRLNCPRSGQPLPKTPRGASEGDESKSTSGLQKAGVKCEIKNRSGSWGKKSETSLLLYNSVHYPSNCATLRTHEGIPLILLYALSGNSVFFSCAGFLWVFCAEFQVWCFPVLPICRPTGIIPNSE